MNSHPHIKITYPSPNPKYIFQIRSILMDFELSNGLCVVYTSRKHLNEVSHESHGAGGEGPIATVIQEEKIQPAIVKHKGNSVIQHASKYQVQ